MPPRAAIYVFFGLIATGKSTLAKAWAEKNGLPYYNSDLVRKELAGLPPTARRQEGLEQGIYSPAFSRRTYGALLEKASREIVEGRGVVLDASYRQREERQHVRMLARRHAYPVYFILCTSPESVLRERLAQRARDPAAVSDGRWEIYLTQREKFEPPTELEEGELIPIETVGPVEQLTDRVEAALQEPLSPQAPI